MGTENTTAGSTPAGQSDPLAVNLGGLDMGALANSGSDLGFNLTSTDTGNPEQFGQHPPETEHQQADPNAPAPAQQPVQEGQGQQPAPAPAPAPGASNINPQDLAAIVRSVMTETAPAIARSAVEASRAPAVAEGQQPQPQYSPEELDKMFNVVRISDNDMQALGFDPGNVQQKAALEGFAHRTAQMAVAIARFQAGNQLTQFRQALAPVLSHVEQQQVNELKTQFYTKHGDLQPHEELLTAIHGELTRGGFKGSHEQWFDAIAQRARAILDRVRSGAAPGQPGSAAPNSQPTVSGGQTQQPQQLGGQSTHRMTTLTGGGQGGAATGAGQQPEKEAGWKVWE